MGRYFFDVAHRRLVLCMLLSLLCLAGCGFLNVAPERRAAAKNPAFQGCIARFYLPYAVLAAAAYGTDTQADYSRSLRDGTRSEREAARHAVEKESDLLAHDNDLTKMRVAVFNQCHNMWEERHKESIQSNNRKVNCNPEVDDCGRHNTYIGNNAELELPLACGSAFRADRKLPNWLNAGSLPYKDDYPSKEDDTADCEPAEESETKVPVTEVAKSVGWERRRDIERYATVREWMIFVPGLGVEVWSRARDQQKYGGPPREYAIVFRGTSEAGGWFSNLRLITGLLPMFWDQYQQAEWSTQQIVEQIRTIEIRKWQLNSEIKVYPSQSDNLAEFNEYFPYITAVGHSLGAGLAKYVYFRVKEISKVVGFNPSPIDGARTFIGADERSHIMTGRRQAEPIEPCSESSEETSKIAKVHGNVGPNIAEIIKDKQPFPFLKYEDNIQNNAVFYALYERGELLNSVTPCSDGPEWGNEGGPESKCQMVDLIRIPYSLKSMFRQHRMNAMACRLAAVLWKVPAPGADQKD